MSNQEIKIPRVSDKRLAEVVAKIANRFSVTPLQIVAQGHCSLAGVDPLAEPTGDWKSLLSLDSYLIETCAFQVLGLNVTYMRGGQKTAHGKSPIYDEILISAEQKVRSTPAERLELTALINQELRGYQSGRVPGADYDSEKDEILAINQGSYDRLQGLTQNLAEQALKIRAQLEEWYQERVSKNEANLEERKSELEDEYSEKIRKAEGKERDYLEKLSKIDDRNNTHARRQIRDKMLDDVKSRISSFGVSPITESKRKPVQYGIYFLALVFVAFIAITSLEIYSYHEEMSNKVLVLSKSIGQPKTSEEFAKEAVDIKSLSESDQTAIYILWLRLTALAFGLIGTILYYIKWVNRWADQHAASEFQLQQFYVDVNRANWVIESCLEWKKETDSPIPPELLGSITKNLFSTDKDNVENVMHPSDELASALLGSSSKLKLRVGDNEIEFDKPKNIPGTSSHSNKSRGSGA